MPKESKEGKELTEQKSELTRDKPVFSPATDIFEKEDSIFVICDMPGVDENNIEVSLENNLLSITGNQTEETGEEWELLHRGYTTGIYKRSFSISEQVDDSQIKAKMKQGVLTIELPKSEKAKPKKIKIETEK